jgi:NAD(P)-dependent dehydrogenase (short-subunit alcohol dehydrogenase family)
VAADLSTAEGAETVVRFVRDCLGGVDILVHNVHGSLATGGGFAALTDDEWQDALNSILLGAMSFDRGLLPLILAQSTGVIIHIFWIQRRLPLFEATLTYAIAKAALSTHSSEARPLNGEQYNKAIFAAYGSKSDLSGEEILDKLLALNLERGK